MHHRLNRNLICSILCVDMVEHSRNLEAEQYRHKARMQAVLASALQGIPENDRVILDTGDGAAIAFFGAPEEALSVALFIADGMAQDRKMYPEDPIVLRSGIHLGPVRVMHDINGAVHFVGDGLNATQRLMSLARPGNTVVSRQYYDIVAPENPDAFRVLSPLGVRTDREGRFHELYIVGKLDGTRSTLWDASVQWLVTPAAGWSAVALGVAVMIAVLLQPLLPRPAGAIPSVDAPAPAAHVNASGSNTQPGHERGLAANEGKPMPPDASGEKRSVHASSSPATAMRPARPKKAVCPEAARMLSKCS